MIFAGAIIGHFTGFKGSVMLPELASTKTIFSSKDQQSIALGFEVRCNRFFIEFYDNGMPKTYLSDLTILEDGKEILTRDIEVNTPLTYKGITFYQSSYQGYQEFIVDIKEIGSNEQQSFVVPFQQRTSWPEKDIHFGIINADALGQTVTRAKIWFRDGENQAVTTWLADNSSTTINSADRSFEVSVKQMYATGLQVAKDPGVWIVYLGCALMLLGLYMAFFVSHRRLWLLVTIDGSTADVSLAGNTNKNRQGFSRQFRQLEETLDSKLRSL